MTTTRTLLAVPTALALTIALAGIAAPRATAAPGNPSGTVALAAGQKAASTAGTKRVVGKGTAKSCTSAALVKAVRAGGVVTFKCGKKPVTITLTSTLKVRNSTKKLVIDGGGKVTLSGAKNKRILYVNTCDRSLGAVSGNCLYAPKWPVVTVQNLRLADGNASKAIYVRWDGRRELEGGGAIFALGGRLKVVKSTFVRNRCATNGPDLGGGAIRVLAQSSPTPNSLDSSYAARNQYPVQIVQSTFGGRSGQGNSCANGGAISTLRTPIVITNSLLSYNAAVGCCSNPAKPGTPGGGSGGATYSDGNNYNVTFAGSRIERNSAKAGGSAVFFVSNNRSGKLIFDRTVSRYNRYVASRYGDQHFQNYAGVFFLGSGKPVLRRATLR